MAKERSRDDYMVCDQCRARKIRCGREKPSCQSCERLDLPCEWSGRPKQFNQITLLHTILGMGSRLQQVETSLAETQRSLKRCFEASSIMSPPVTTRPGSPSRSTAHSSPQNFRNPFMEPIFPRPTWRFLSDQGDKRCFGPTSLESLMLNIKDDFSAISRLESNMLGECISQSQRKLDLLVLQGQVKHAGESSLPTTPPFAILDAMIEMYFGSVNHHFPIWTKKRFIQMASELRRASSSERDLASIVCCNNLILMAMSAESLCAYQRDSIQSQENRQTTSSIDSDIIAGFLANAKRAINNVDKLVSPRLINIQALLSLHMVAHEHLSIGQSETLFVLASHCAKSVGIHQWHSFEGQLSDEDVAERLNLSQCLYTLDKAVCWTAGTSPNVTLSEVHFDSRPVSSESSVISSYHVSNAEMASIEEAIYSEIYAIHAKPRNEDQVRAFAASVLSRLQNCLAASGADHDQMEKESESSATGLQLIIRSLCIRLLLTWPHKGHPDPAFQRVQEVARTCMKSVLRLWHAQPDRGNHAVFPLFLASLPPLYLYQVLSTIINNQESSSDVEMLRKYIEMLQTITECRAEASYNRRLYQLSSVVIDVINMRESQHKRHKSTSEGPANAYPIPELHSPPTAGLPSMDSDMQEVNNLSRFDGGIFQEQHRPSASRSPTTTRHGDLSRDSDDYQPQIWSYTDTNIVSGIDSFPMMSMDELNVEDGFSIFPARGQTSDSVYI